MRRQSRTSMEWLTPADGGREAAGRASSGPLPAVPPGIAQEDRAERGETPRIHGPIAAAVSGPPASALACWSPPQRIVPGVPGNSAGTLAGPSPGVAPDVHHRHPPASMPALAHSTAGMGCVRNAGAGPDGPTAGTATGRACPLPPCAGRPTHAWAQGSLSGQVPSGTAWRVLPAEPSARQPVAAPVCPTSNGAHSPKRPERTTQHSTREMTRPRTLACRRYGSVTAQSLAGATAAPSQPEVVPDCGRCSSASEYGSGGRGGPPYTGRSPPAASERSLSCGAGRRTAAAPSNCLRRQPTHRRGTGRRPRRKGPGCSSPWASR